jgi:flagellar hook-associated protein 3 FlgL
MRVTDKALFEAGRTNIMLARSRSDEAMQEASSGRRVVHPGDDSAAAGLIIGHKMAVARNEAIGAAVGRAADELDAADGALSSVSDLLSRARQLAVQLSNDTYNAQDRAAAAVEVEALRGQAVAAMNVRSGQRYLFGGFLDGSPPFDAAGNYSGDTNTRSLEVSPGVFQSVSLRGDVAMKGANGGVDIFDTLNALSTALNNNDAAAIRATLEPLDQGTSQVSVVRSQGGGISTLLTVAGTAARTNKDTEDKQRAALEDADIVDSATKLAFAEQALNAAMSAAVKSFNLSLVDKL